MRISYEELLLRAIAAIKGAIGCGRLSCANPDEARFNLAAVRAWTNRAEYSLDTDLELSESDFAKADKEQFERLLGDYGNGARIVIEDFSGTICDPKWRNVPQNIGQAEAAIVGLQCPMCYSPMLLPFIRPPVNVWKVHCNHCATEIPIVVLLNRVAWMV